MTTNNVTKRRSQVLVDCRSTDDVVIYAQKDCCLNSEEIVVHIDV